MKKPLSLAEGEYRFAALVWANEPLSSGQLVRLAAEALGWKKSTTYTVLKKLCERGILLNEGGRRDRAHQAGRSAAADQRRRGWSARSAAACRGSWPRF